MTFCFFRSQIEGKSGVGKFWAQGQQSRPWNLAVGWPWSRLWRAILKGLALANGSPIRSWPYLWAHWRLRPAIVSYASVSWREPLCFGRYIVPCLLICQDLEFLGFSFVRLWQAIRDVLQTYSSHEWPARVELQLSLTYQSSTHRAEAFTCWDFTCRLISRTYLTRLLEGG